MVEKDYRLGHRERVKHRFLTYGFDSFFPYEILEMLLFFVIPRKDTKGLAHALCDRFQGLKGVLTASAEELKAFPGVGEKTASFLSSLMPFATYVAEEEPIPRTYVTEDDFGNFFMHYYRTRQSSSVSVDIMLLSNRGDLLRMIHLSDKTDGLFRYSPEEIVKYCFEANASMITIGIYTEKELTFPSQKEKEKYIKFASTLSDTGICLCDCLTVSCDDFASIFQPTIKKLSSRLKKIPYDIEVLPLEDEKLKVSEQKLASILSFAMKPEEAEPLAVSLLKNTSSVATLMQMSFDFLRSAEGMTDKAVLLLKTISGLYSNVFLSDALSKKEEYHTAGKMGEMFKGIHALRDREVISLALFDETDKLIDIKLVSCGSVNSSSFAIRELVEFSMKNHAVSVAMAHNHPLGTVEPSPEDVSTTDALSNMFSNYGIVYIEHFITTDRAFFPIGLYQGLCVGATEQFYVDLPDKNKVMSLRKK
ncbi:MAG: hypothetical protein MJ078_01160 [Clostridia bacterium]|nr:hypothetical protein [Clostridia bacterium]